ncbi:ComEC/Rec2 family competence protein [Agromyces aurantiacus]|uniref:ComEC/Rec2 family competence protein n=1 Tax=Agromyces aurantiacus TaxID=165814 RepID=A0ABV9R9R3_9MICO|nr:ComEC/Rec2 family competence protein [Agromyces aurantiacus]MBM7504631.1 competence protein ComEC [Agromyces aurantiacus]
MRRHDLRLLGPAAATWAAAWLATGATDAAVAPWLVAAVCWGAAALGLGLTASRARLRVPRSGPSPGPVSTSGGAGIRSVVGAMGPPLAVAAACAALASTLACTGLLAREDSPLATPAETRETVELTARLDSSLRPGTQAPWGGTPSERARATVLSVDGRTTAPVRIDLVLPSTDGADRPAGFGDEVTVRARVTALPGISRAAFRVQASEVITAGAAPEWIAWTHPLRAGLAEQARRLGGDGGALVPGLAIGDTARLPADLADAMSAASLTHLTAVSGANCALVTAIAFWAAGLLRAPRGVRVAAALAALTGFVVLVTPESSVVRAAAMALVVLVAVATGRAGGGAPALGVAVVVLLAADPWYSRDAGFALSVCATAGLVLGARPLASALAARMPRPLAAALAVPLAAQLACQPVLVLLDPVLPVYGVPANLLAAPAAPIATMAGLVGCLLLPVLPSVGFAALQVAWLPASWIALLARGVSGMPNTAVPWLPDAPGAALCAVAVAAAAVLLGARRRPVDGARRRPVLRPVAVGVLCLAVAVPIGVTAGRPALTTALLPADWDVLQCDIGQGDAVLVRDHGATLLIDTGPDPERLTACLALAGVRRVDLAVITHWDADHAGGAAAIAGRVGLVLHGPLDGARSDRVLGPLARGGAELVQVGAGASGRLGAADWRVLWPPARAEPGNDASVVLDLRAEQYRAVFLGDLGAEAQAALLREADPGRADLVKVAHHGSADQDPALYRELAPAVGLIGVGADNGYGHPTASLLDLLDAQGVAVVRSDSYGAAALTVDGDRVRVWSERAPPGAGGVVPAP